MTATLMGSLSYIDRLEAAAGGTAHNTPQVTGARARIETDPHTWARALFPKQTRQPFVGRHDHMWSWFWQMVPGIAPDPFIAIWPRGGGKSTNAQIGTVSLGARELRRYGLYVSGTQPQADKHVQSVAALLGSPALARYYPLMGQRDVNKYGASKGWRRDRLRTALGFTLEGVGLDVSVRGFKDEDVRPDFIVLDDIDARHDSPHMVRKKIETITESILPTGSDDCAVIFVQNRVHGASIASSFIDGSNTFLINHLLSGPFPAVEGLVYEERDEPDGRRKFHIVGGVATWPGQDIQTCEKQINEWGPEAFRAEAQHEKKSTPGGMFSHLKYRHIVRAELPEMVRTAVWVDPAVSNTDDSDCYAVSAAGIDYNDIIYRIYSWEDRTSPEDAVRRAVLKAIELGSPTVGVETDQGGDTWQSVYWRAVEAIQAELAKLGRSLDYVPRFRAAKAGSFGSKVHRASQMLPDYERGEIVHVIGTHELVEAALFRFPKVKPFDLTDASFWSWADLRGMIPSDDDGPGILLTGSTAGWFGGSMSSSRDDGYSEAGDLRDELGLEQDYREYAPR